MKIAVIGQFERWGWGQHPDEAYFADALEKIGVQVIRVNPAVPANPPADADWAFFSGHPDSRSKLSVWSRTHRTIFWTLDWLPFFNRDDMIEIARTATLFVSSDEFDWEGVYGIRNHVYLPGACEGVPVEFDPKPKRPCAWLGSLYNDRRRAIAKLVMKLGGEARIQPGGWVYGRDLAKYVQETKVVVGDNARSDVPGYWSSRNYVIPGAGGFLLTPSVPGLSDQFEIGKHLATFDSLDALEGELRRWIDDDPGRETIRRAGFDHVQLRHNWKERARTLIGLLETRWRA